MSERKTKKLEEIVSRFIDYRGKTPTKTDSGVPLITAKIVKDGGLSPYTEYIADGSYNHWMTRGIPEKDDVIITTEAPLGEVALMPEGQVALAQRIIVMHTNPEECDSIYLKYFLQWKVGKQCVLNRQSGSTVFGIRSAELKKAQVSIHADIHEQKTIASLLYAIDKKIEVNRRINDNLEAMAQALYDYWFVQFDFPDENGRPYKSSGGRMVWNDQIKREIPDGWEVVPLHKMANVVGGSTPYTKRPDNFATSADMGIPWITPKDLSAKSDLFIARGEVSITEKGRKEASLSILPPGSILFSSRAPIGYIAITAGFVTTNQGFKSLVPLQKNSTLYLYYLMESLVPYFIQAAGITTFKEVSGNQVKAVQIIRPPANVLMAFHARTAPLLQRRKTTEDNSRKLTALRDFLLPLLMSGQVQVKPQGELNYHLAAD